MNEFEVYKAWCKIHNLKPSNPDVLKRYVEFSKEVLKVE